MRLLTSILAERCNWTMFPELKQEVLEVLRRDAFAVDIQNVYSWISDTVTHQKSKSVKFEHLCPLFKLPFPALWCEYSTTVKYEEMAGSDMEENVQIGALFHDEGFAGAEGDKEDTPTTRLELFWKMPDEKKASHMASCLLSSTDDFELKSIRQMKSKVFENFLEKRTEAGFESEDGDVEAFEEVVQFLLYRGFFPAAASVAFFHCKNVQIKTVERQPKLEKKLRKKYSIPGPIPSFHVIEVHKGTTHTISKQTAEDARNARRLQIGSFVRGHFKKYIGVDHKLYGKHNGIWFWDMHTRGDGAPVKSEYRAWPPEGSHEKNCLVQIES